MYKLVSETHTVHSLDTLKLYAHKNTTRRQSSLQLVHNIT